MNADSDVDDDLEDDDDDDDDADDKEDDEDDWADDEDSEDDVDDDEPETWQVVDFPAANCLDWPDFPAQPGWTSFSRALASRRRSSRP